MAIGVKSPDVRGDQAISGFTSLGSDAPAIKQKYLTLTLAGVGETASIEHGLTLSKIISVNILVPNTDGNLIPSSFSLYGSTVDSYFTYLVESVLLKVLTGASATAIAGNTARILITYTE